ncbi:MAG: glycosyltransferase family 4 protein [Flavobacteriales bacterium]|nr:glycosyltransferase family 4 protein [Flavobacteriales bacterium]
MAKLGYDVKLVVVNAADTHSDYTNVEIVNIQLAPVGKMRRVLNYPKQVLNKVLELAPAVAHLHDPELLQIVSPLKAAGIKVIYDAHEDVPKQVLTKDWIPGPLRGMISRMVQGYEHKMAPNLDAVVTVVEGVLERFEPLVRHIVLVKNFPDLDKLPRPMPWSEKADEVAYIGDLTRIRGIREVVDAMADVNAQLNLAGKWSDRGLEGDCKRSPGWTKVTPLGFISSAEARAVLERSLIGLILFHPAPNHIDALPNKLFEYMAAGIPVVASDFGWLKHIVEQRKCGVTADPKDPKSIARAIQSLLDDPEVAEAMGSRGREAVMHTYNWDTEAKKLGALYHTLIGSPA